MATKFFSMPGIESGSSLAHAAQRLAEAVATLADVAQAVSAAANEFSLEVLAHEPKSTITAPVPTESVPIVLYESESESSTIDEAPSVAYATGTPGKAGSICSEETEYTNPEDSDYYQLDVVNHDQVSVFHSNEQTNGTRTEGADRPPSSEPISIDQPRSDPTHRPSAIPEGAFSDVVTELNQGYHILVDNEADVLLFVCALLRAREGLKAICYMSCSLPAFNLYKKLINDVTGSPTYAVTKTTPAELESVGKSFIEGNNGVLLLPETVCPDIKLGNTDSWVIHIGWPVDEQKFDEQRKTHEAQHNILIGCSADENLYPAGYAAMWESLPWPGDTDSFRLSVGTLRPLFNGKLDLIPIQMKEKIYPDWIASHGSRGRRYVRSWTSSDLVGRANNYLLDVLRYHDPSEAPHSDSTQANLPEVSAGFVAHNGLEWAVEEGLLHIKSSPGINHISSHLKTHLLTPDTAQIPTVFKKEFLTLVDGLRVIIDLLQPRGKPTARPIQSSHRDPKAEDQSGKILQQVPPASRPRLTFGSLGSSDAALGDTASLGFSGPGQGGEHPTGPASAFQPTPGFTYLVLQEEFDAIPLICFLATTTEAKKTILFVEDAESTPSYKLLLHEITGNLVITPDLVHDDQSREDAALQFLVYRGSAILLMSYKCKKLPTRLHDTPVDYCIYWGEGNFAPLLQAKKHRPRLDCRSTIVIMTNYQKVKLEKSLRDIQAHPSSADLLNPNQSPWLAATRDITKSCLNSKKDIVRGLYEARLRCLAGVPRDVKSAEEIVYEANQYAARVLLRGDPEDGSQTFPPVGGMIAVPSSMVRALKLQSAVTAGLLMVLA